MEVSQSSLKSSFCALKKPKKQLASFYLDQGSPTAGFSHQQSASKGNLTPLERKNKPSKHAKTKSMNFKAKDLIDLKSFTIDFFRAKKPQLTEPNRLGSFITPKSKILKKERKSKSKDLAMPFNILEGSRRPSGMADGERPGSHQQHLMKKRLSSPLHVLHQRNKTQIVLGHSVTASNKDTLSSFSPIHSRHISVLQPPSDADHCQRLASSSIVPARKASSPKIISKSQLRRLQLLFEQKRHSLGPPSTVLKFSGGFLKPSKEAEGGPVVKTQFKSADSPFLKSTADANCSRRGVEAPREPKFRFEDREKIDYLESTDRQLDYPEPNTKYTEASHLAPSQLDTESPNNSVTKYLQACKFNFADNL